ncbi:MAG: hypothetical protein HYZ34_02955 [Ignavibacteriae bacterium]|nr:hypothetical protein [Ignavibacteriota bacterium]
MKVRKTKDIIRVLKQKGFEQFPEKQHHHFFYLVINGKKQHIHTYFSHGLNEYGEKLMSIVKKQLRFRETSTAEGFFDCPISGEDYIEMLRENGEV